MNILILWYKRAIQWLKARKVTHVEEQEFTKEDIARIAALRESYNILMEAAEAGDNERISAWAKDVTAELEAMGVNLVE